MMERHLTYRQRMQKEAQEKLQMEQEIKAKHKAKRENIIFMRRIMAVTFLVIGLFTMVSFASDVTAFFDKDNIDLRTQESLKDYNQVTVLVQDGDTAWEIQKKLLGEYDYKGDMRDILYLVDYVNDYNMKNMKAGKEYIFLEPKENK